MEVDACEGEKGHREGRQERKGNGRNIRREGGGIERGRGGRRRLTDPICNDEAETAYRAREERRKDDWATDDVIPLSWAGRSVEVGVSQAGLPEQGRRRCWCS